MPIPQKHPLSRIARENDPRLDAAYKRHLIFHNPKARSLFIDHAEKWADCDHCGLCSHRRHTVLYRGHMPSHVLFVGEGPGDTENLLGYPFTGPAGSEFDDLRKAAWSKAFMEGYTAIGRIPTWGMSNIVACHPKEPDPEGLSSARTRPPTKDEAICCSPRLTEILMLATPRLVVALGDIAARYLKYSMPEPPAPGPRLLKLVHPSAILRIESQILQNSARKRFMLTLSQALDGVLPHAS
jgi:uracil-DNA glycosylase family 4